MLFVKRKKQVLSQDGFRSGDIHRNIEGIVRRYLKFSSFSYPETGKDICFVPRSSPRGTLVRSPIAETLARVSHEAAVAVFAASHVVAEPWLAMSSTSEPCYNFLQDRSSFSK